MLTVVENELFLRQIAENIEQVFWLRDIPADRILYASPAFETVWGRTCTSLYADAHILIESVHPEDRVQVMVARPHNGHSPLSQSFRIVRPDGDIRWVHMRTFPIKSENGGNGLQVSIAQDITDHKQVELDLHKTLDRTQELFTLSRKMSLARKPEAVLKILMSVSALRTGRKAVLFFFNDPRVLPVQMGEVTATWTSSHTPAPWKSELSLYEEPAFWELPKSNQSVTISSVLTDSRLSTDVRKILLEGQVASLEILPLVTLRGWRGCLIIYFDKQHTFDHQEQRHIKILVDQAAVTLSNLQLLEVEGELRHEAERANQIKTDFLAMISHELRTPLTSILGFTTTLLADDVTWEPEEQHDFISTIQREAERLQELIDHLLDLSRLEAGRLPIKQSRHDLHEILADAMPQLQTLTGGRTFILDIPLTLPPVFVDATRIAQVLVNLVRNAAMYAPAGTDISLTANVRGNFIQVNVNDLGPGIPSAEHKKVFQAFRRGANVENGVTKGAGLGLAICKGLVEAHGGRIWIRRSASPGTTISFTIPLAQIDSPVEVGREER